MVTYRISCPSWGLMVVTQHNKKNIKQPRRSTHKAPVKQNKREVDTKTFHYAVDWVMEHHNGTLRELERY